MGYGRVLSVFHGVPHRLGIPELLRSGHEMPSQELMSLDGGAIDGS